MSSEISDGKVTGSAKCEASPFGDVIGSCSVSPSDRKALAGASDLKELPVKKDAPAPIQQNFRLKTDSDINHGNVADLMSSLNQTVRDAKRTAAAAPGDQQPTLTVVPSSKADATPINTSDKATGAGSIETPSIPVINLMSQSRPTELRALVASANAGTPVQVERDTTFDRVSLERREPATSPKTTNPSDSVFNPNLGVKSDTSDPRPVAQPASSEARLVDPPATAGSRLQAFVTTDSGTPAIKPEKAPTEARVADPKPIAEPQAEQRASTETRLPEARPAIEQRAASPLAIGDNATTVIPPVLAKIGATGARAEQQVSLPAIDSSARADTTAGAQRSEQPRATVIPTVVAAPGSERLGGAAKTDQPFDSNLRSPRSENQAAPEPLKASGIPDVLPPNARSTDAGTPRVADPTATARATGLIENTLKPADSAPKPAVAGDAAPATSRLPGATDVNAGTARPSLSSDATAGSAKPLGAGDATAAAPKPVGPGDTMIPGAKPISAGDLGAAGSRPSVTNDSSPAAARVTPMDASTTARPPASGDLTTGGTRSANTTDASVRTTSTSDNSTARAIPGSDLSATLRPNGMMQADQPGAAARTVLGDTGTRTNAGSDQTTPNTRTAGIADFSPIGARTTAGADQTAAGAKPAGMDINANSRSSAGADQITAGTRTASTEVTGAGNKPAIGPDQAAAGSRTAASDITGAGTRSTVGTEQSTPGTKTAASEITGIGSRSTIGAEQSTPGTRTAASEITGTGSRSTIGAEQSTPGTRTAAPEITGTGSRSTIGAEQSTPGTRTAAPETSAVGPRSAIGAEQTTPATRTAATDSASVGARSSIGAEQNNVGTRFAATESNSAGPKVTIAEQNNAGPRFTATESSSAGAKSFVAPEQTSAGARNTPMGEGVPPASRGTSYDGSIAGVRTSAVDNSQGGKATFTADSATSGARANADIAGNRTTSDNSAGGVKNTFAPSESASVGSKQSFTPDSNTSRTIDPRVAEGWRPLESGTPVRSSDNNATRNNDGIIKSAEISPSRNNDGIIKAADMSPSRNNDGIIKPADISPSRNSDGIIKAADIPPSRNNDGTIKPSDIQSIRTADGVVQSTDASVRGEVSAIKAESNVRADGSKIDTAAAKQDGITQKGVSEFTDKLAESLKGTNVRHEDDKKHGGIDKRSPVTEVYQLPSFMDAMGLADLVKMLDKRNEEIKPVERQKMAAAQQSIMQQPQYRTRYVVQQNDTLSSIAVRKLGDERFAGLLVTINRAEIHFINDNGKSVPVVYPHQVIWLPTQSELDIHRKHFFGSSKSRSNLGAGSEQQTPMFRKVEIGEPTAAGRKLHEETILHKSARTLIKPSTSPQSSPIAMALHRVRYSGNRKEYNIENFEPPVTQITERRCYQVRLGETLQSVALRDPLMRDSHMWPLLAKINGLSQETDSHGKPVTQLSRGQYMVLPTQSEIDEYRLLNRMSALVCAKSAIDCRPSVNLGQRPVFFDNGDSSSHTELDNRVQNFSDFCRMVVSETNAMGIVFDVRLQAQVMSTWVTVASYECYSEQTMRTVCHQNGSRNKLTVDLPAEVARQMAKEDFTRNWHLYYNSYLTQTPRSAPTQVKGRV
jgi:hypothetical protein